MSNRAQQNNVAATMRNAALSPNGLLSAAVRLSVRLSAYFVHVHSLRTKIHRKVHSYTGHEPVQQANHYTEANGQKSR